MSDKIEVMYDGTYPTKCYGTLTIKVNGKEIYSKCDVCHSTGTCGWTDNGDDYVAFGGELVWNEDESKNFSKEIQDAVADKLSEFHVCCGGCI